MIQVFDLGKSYSSRDLFSGVTFSIMQGERIGLVGRNGSGKSTLSKIIMGKEASDKGEIIIPKGYSLGYLDQHIHFSKDTLLEESCLALSEEEKYDFYKAEKILFGLGFNQEDLQKNPNQFSGGYQLRINLCKTILRRPNLLVLDEPTNYLDILSMRWMQKFLQSFDGEIILITHDREFMDSVCTHTMGIHRSKLKKIKGGTLKYYEQLDLDEEIFEKTREAQQRKIKHMQKFVDRFRAQANKATQAQSRLKKIEKMQVADALEEEQSLGFEFQYKETHAKTLMRVKDLSFAYTQESPTLFQDLSFELNAKDRIAIIGKNGKGKSTLLNVISGDLKALNGETVMHPSAQQAYYQQTHRKDLVPENTIIEEVTEHNPNLSISQVRAICGAMMFSGDDAKKKIQVLSGGEQSRVLLGKTLARQANVLLLDEPSNHLDMESIEAITHEIAKFPGAVILVTHNEGMLKRLANRLIIFHEGHARLFEGRYKEFLEKIGWQEEVKIKKEKAPQVKSQSNNKYSERKIKKLEKRLHKLEEEQKQKDQLLLKLSSEGKHGPELTELSKELEDLNTKIETTLEELIKLNDSLT